MFSNVVKQVIAIAALCFAFGASSSYANDININPVGPNFPIKNLVWGSSGAVGINNNFWFSPLFSSGSICVYVRNNNPTSAHTFSAQVYITGDPAEQTPSDGTWVSYSSPLSLTVNAEPSTDAVFGASISGAALVSINISGSSSQSGSPDTANISIQQTPSGNCQITPVGNQQATVNAYLYFHTASSGNMSVKSSPGFFHNLVINNFGVGDVVTIYDSSASGCSPGTVIATIGGATSTQAGPFPVLYDVNFKAGLCISDTGTEDLTVSYY